jgi:two-component system, response regulator, stage 0 sporulation protein F
MSDKPTILYIDDEPLNVMLFEINFSKRYTVITAKSGYEGLEKLKENEPIKVVFSDMKMPGMNGVEFITQAKISFPEKAYFILTGYDLLDDIASALKSKLIQKYFCKPFNVPEIEKTIIESLSNI